MEPSFKTELCISYAHNSLFRLPQTFDNFQVLYSSGYLLIPSNSEEEEEIGAKNIQRSQKWLKIFIYFILL